jgi:hypothetical protein
MIASLVSIAAVCVSLSSHDVLEVGKILRDTRKMPHSARAHLLKDSPRCRQIAEAAGYKERPVSVVQMHGLYAVLFGDELRVLDGQLRPVSLQQSKRK